jgi:mRNA-degrading endonuclease YafQ of YafQ-DinJ toxin-antitoxin module
VEILFTKRFIKRYKKKTKEQQERVEKTLLLLADNPWHPGLHTGKVQGTRDIFEAYVDASMRATFQFGENCIIMRNNCIHNMVLRRP